MQSFASTNSTLSTNDDNDTISLASTSSLEYEARLSNARIGGGIGGLGGANGGGAPSSAADRDMTEDEVAVMVRNALRKARRAMNNCSPTSGDGGGGDDDPDRVVPAVDSAEHSGGGGSAGGGALAVWIYQSPRDGKAPPGRWWTCKQRRSSPTATGTRRLPRGTLTRPSQIGGRTMRRGSGSHGPRTGLRQRPRDCRG